MTIESRGGMTTSGEIIINYFEGIMPTLREIVDKFPPKAEIIKRKAKDGTIITVSAMVSRAGDEAGTILYIVPSASWDPVRKDLFKESPQPKRM